MVFVKLRAKGFQTLYENQRKIIKNINGITQRYPILAARAVKQAVSTLINNESYKTYERHGPYRRATGRGIVDELRVYSIKKGEAILDVDPAASANDSAPSIYATWVEVGNSNVRNPKRYFERGLRLALKDIRKINNR